MPVQLADFITVYGGETEQIRAAAHNCAGAAAAASMIRCATVTKVHA